MATDYAEKIVEFKHSTPKALLLGFEDDNWHETWVPRSVIENEEEVEEGETTASIAEWWLDKNALL